MAKILEMPKLSPTMEEGQISVWHKKEGDAIAVDDLLAEVETDKATMEYRSFDAGTLLKILAPAGSVVKLGQPVAVVGKPGEAVPAGAEAGAASASAIQAAAGDSRGGSNRDPAAPGEPLRRPQEPSALDPAAHAGAARPLPTPSEGDRGGRDRDPDAIGRVRASPYVRKLAHERGVDLHAVAGSGPNGRIVARDLDGRPIAAPAAISFAPPSSAPSELREPERRPLSMMRKAIARRLTESKQTVPHFYLTIDVDADPLHQLREAVNRDLVVSLGEDAPKVSFNDLIVKACSIALVRVPECNAEFTADAILLHRRVDISVAVAVAEGLVTPVVRDADRKSVLAIAREVRDLAARAKAKKLKPEEMANGTFSISNLGMFGVDEFAAVINPPEGAILAVGQVRREPVVKGDAIVPGRKLAMTLSCDHRVVDGAVGASFLKALRQLVEHPTQILVG